MRNRAIIDPLSRREDILAGKHGNTQVPKLLGSLVRYLRETQSPWRVRLYQALVLVQKLALFALGRDGALPAALSKVHPRYRTPAGGIAIQAVWAVALALSGTYGQLLDYVVFGDWIFFGLIVATIFAYRWRDASTGTAPNVFRMPGYPLLPALFVTIAAYVVVSVIWSNPRNALLGALLIALGVPAFLFWRGQSRAEMA